MTFNQASNKAYKLAVEMRGLIDIYQHTSHDHRTYGQMDKELAEFMDTIDQRVFGFRPGLQSNLGVI